MSSELKDALKKRLDENYTAFIKSLQEKTVSELIAMAPEITAAQQLHEELPDVCDDAGAKYLLQFDDPLETLRGLWADALTGSRTEEISHFVWEVQDRELVEEVPKMVKQVSTDDLRRMEGQEGLVLQGCGGPPQEWVDGTNGLLTEAGILLDGCTFRVEDVSVFQHGELTCLLFPFEGVKLDTGRLAMWRLQTHDQFGGTWLSDYVPNQLGGFTKAGQTQDRVKPPCPLIGQNGNIFNLVGIAAATLRENGMETEAKEMTERIMGGGCHSYEEALSILTEYVQPTDILTEQPQKSQKKKGRSAYER